MSQIEQMPFLDHKKSSLIRNKTHSTIICPLIHLLILPLDFTSSIGFGHSMALYGPGNCPHDQSMALFDNDVATKTCHLLIMLDQKTSGNAQNFLNEKPTSRRTKQDALLPDSDGRPGRPFVVSFRSRAANDIIVTKTMWFSQTSSTKCQLYPQILLKKCPATKKN